MNRPLIFVALTFTMGLALGRALGTHGLVTGIILAVLCLVLLLGLKIKDNKFKLIFALWLVAIGMAWFALAQEKDSVLTNVVGKEVVVTGQVVDFKANQEKQVLLIRLKTLQGFEVESKELFRVALVKHFSGPFEYGQVLRLKGKIELIAENGNPGTFSYREFLRLKGIYSQLTPAAKPEIIGYSGSRLGKWAEEFRKHTRSMAEKSMGIHEVAILRGILFGEDQDLTPEDLEVFSTTGVLHAFAVSGSNVAFVMFLGLTASSFLPRVLSLVITAGAIVFYTVLTGGEGPVLRAAIMGLLVLVGKGLSRDGDGLNSLALAALIMLVYNPNLLVDAGFQLSFAATWGLIALVPRMSGGIKLKNLKELLLFPLAAQIATLPLIAYYFNQVSLIGVGANILVTWFLALILEIGLTGAVLGLTIPLIGGWLLASVGLVIKLTLWILANMAKLPGAVWVTKPSMIAVGVYYLLLIAWIYRQLWLDRLKSLKGFRHGREFIAVVVLVSVVISGLPASKNLSVEFLDVGQGDSILLITPGQKYYLIDGGPKNESFDTGKSVVVPYLLSKGIKHLDGVFLSHPHDDHSGGLIEVVKVFPVDNFYMPPVPEGNLGLWQDLNKILISKGVPIKELSAGDQLVLDKGVAAAILSPGDPYKGTRSDINNNSLIMDLRYYSVSFLLTGDVEMEALANLRGKINQGVSVLKLPHHGSKYGLDEVLWDSVQPGLAVISVGKNNFGQPAPEVMDYWQERQTTQLRTDRDGRVLIRTDGKGVSVYIGREELPLRVP